MNIITNTRTEVKEYILFTQIQLFKWKEREREEEEQRAWRWGRGHVGQKSQSGQWACGRMWSCSKGFPDHTKEAIPDTRKSVRQGLWHPVEAAEEVRTSEKCGQGVEE